MRNNYSVTTTIGANWLKQQHAQIIERFAIRALEIDTDLKDGFYLDASKKLVALAQQLEQDLHKLFTDLMEPK